jgi:hypothetical protein
MTAPRTVYDEVREQMRAFYPDLQWTPREWRECRDLWERDVESGGPNARNALTVIAALAIAQIEALDRRSVEGGK